MNGRGLLARLADSGGTAAAEFALWTAVLIVPLLNVIDIGVYVTNAMALESAAAAVARMAWSACPAGALRPVTRNCPDLLGSLDAAARGGGPGEAITISPGYPVEAFYCTQGPGAMTLVGAPGRIPEGPTAPEPFACAGTDGRDGPAPGDYLEVRLSYAFQPVLPGLSVTALLSSPISRTVWVRLG